MFRSHKPIYREILSQEKIIEALKTAKEAQTINIEMDGGEFSAKNK